MSAVRVLDLNDKLLALTKENDAEEVFTQIQNYMEMLLKSNLENPSLKVKLIEDIKSIEAAKKQTRLNMNIQTVVENLCFKLIL